MALKVHFILCDFYHNKKIHLKILFNEPEFEGPLSLSKDFRTQSLTELQMARILVFLGLT